MNIKKEVFIGCIIGLLANMVGSYLYMYFFSTHSVAKTIETAYSQGILGAIITLGAILNLLAFFILLKKGQTYKAKGVLITTIFIAIFIMALKFN